MSDEIYNVLNMPGDYTQKVIQIHEAVRSGRSRNYAYCPECPLMPSCPGHITLKDVDDAYNKLFGDDNIKEVDISDLFEE